MRVPSLSTRKMNVAGRASITRRRPIRLSIRQEAHDHLVRHQPPALRQAHRRAIVLQQPQWREIGQLRAVDLVERDGRGGPGRPRAIPPRAGAVRASASPPSPSPRRSSPGRPGRGCPPAPPRCSAAPAARCRNARPAGANAPRRRSQDIRHCASRGCCGASDSFPATHRAARRPSWRSRSPRSPPRRASRRGLVEIGLPVVVRGSDAPARDVGRQRRPFLDCQGVERDVLRRERDGLREIGLPVGRRSVPPSRRSGRS